jgi:hypothetical protein
MQILHTITKTESGYTIKVWEPAETTQDRVRPFLWEMNLDAATADECGLVLEQINLLYQDQSKKQEMASVSSQDLAKVDCGNNFSEAIILPTTALLSR